MCTMPFLSQCWYVTVESSLCTGFFWVTVLLSSCTTPIVPQGLICHKVQYVVGLGLGFGSCGIHTGPCAYRACDTMDCTTQWDPFHDIQHGAYWLCDRTGMFHIGLYLCEHWAMTVSSLTLSCVSCLMLIFLYKYGGVCVCVSCLTLSCMCKHWAVCFCLSYLMLSCLSLFVFFNTELSVSVCLV